MGRMNDDVRNKLLDSMGVLMKRRADTLDPSEKAAITHALRVMNIELDRLDQEEMIYDAKAITKISGALDKVTRALRVWRRRS